MFGRRKRARATLQIPSVEIPSLELGGGRLPTIRTPELRTPEIELPRVEIPSVDLGGLRLPHIETPSIQTPRFDFELLGQPPFVRTRRRTNPILRALLFLIGLGLGLVVGALIAALLAPATGEDTRRQLAGLVGGGAAGDGASGGGEAGRSGLPIATGAVREGVAGLLSNPKGRFQLALEEARRERESKERELRAEFETAKRTGQSPD